MSQLSRSAITTDINNNIYNNTNREISGLDVGNRMINIKDSFVSREGDDNITAILRYSAAHSISNAWDLVHKTYVDSAASTKWDIAGNTLSARAKFGSTSGNFGFDFYKNNVVVGGLSDTARWYLGVSAEFTDTSFSFKTLGNDNTTVAHWIKNSSDTTLVKILDGGEFLIGRSDLVSGTQFNIKALGSTNSFYPVYIVNSSNTELFQILAGGSGKYVFGPTGGTVDMVNIGASAANTYIRINADSGYDSGFRLYENSVFKGGFLSDSVGNVAQFYGQNVTAAINIDADNNIGIRGTSFGGGEGVEFMGNATTATSSDPTGGVIREIISGTTWNRLPTGENICVSGRYIIDSNDYTQLIGDTTLEYTGTGGHTFTLHTAVGYKNTEVTIINNGTGSVTCNSVVISAGDSIKFISNGTNWL